MDSTNSKYISNYYQYDVFNRNRKMLFYEQQTEIHFENTTSSAILQKIEYKTGIRKETKFDNINM